MARFDRMAQRLLQGSRVVWRDCGQEWDAVVVGHGRDSGGKFVSIETKHGVYQVGREALTKVAGRSPVVGKAQETENPAGTAQPTKDP